MLNRAVASCDTGIPACYFRAQAGMPVSRGTVFPEMAKQWLYRFQNQKSRRIGSDGFCFEIYVASVVRPGMKHLSFCCLVVRFSGVPIHNIPECGDVAWAHVLILQVVSVLPNV